MTTIETILLTNLFHFEGDGRLHQNEEFSKLERQSAINSLAADYKELSELEIDLTDDYDKTIKHLKAINDSDYEKLKTDILDFKNIKVEIVA